MTGFVESALVFLAGLLLRFALLILVVAAFAVPILLALKAWGGAGVLWQRAHGVQKVSGLPWRSAIRYARSHAWLAGRGGAVRVGLDSLAQRLIGPAGQLGLPAVGREVREGEVVGTIGSQGRRVNLVAPIGGRVTAVNHRLGSDPSRVSRDPYLSGWLYALTPSDRRWETLPSGEPARRWFQAEADRLQRAVEQKLGLAAADGGELLLPPAWSLPEAEWQSLAETFLSVGGRDGN